jgi:hypothetical protein
MVYEKARQSLQAGAIGKINVIDAWWDRTPNSPVLAFDASIPPDASTETVDWDRFLGTAPRGTLQRRAFLKPPVRSSKIE